MCIRFANLPHFASFLIHFFLVFHNKKNKIKFARTKIGLPKKQKLKTNKPIYIKTNRFIHSSTLWGTSNSILKHLRIVKCVHWIRFGYHTLPCRDIAHHSHYNYHYHQHHNHYYHHYYYYSNHSH